MLSGVKNVNLGCGIAGNRTLPKTSIDVLKENLEKDEAVREAVLTAKKEMGVPLTKAEKVDLAYLRAQRLLKPMLTPTVIFANGNKGVKSPAFGSRSLDGRVSERLAFIDDRFSSIPLSNEQKRYLEEQTEIEGAIGLNKSMAEKISKLDYKSFELIMATDPNGKRIFSNVILNKLDEQGFYFGECGKDGKGGYIIGLNLKDGKPGGYIKESLEYSPTLGRKCDEYVINAWTGPRGGEYLSIRIDLLEGKNDYSYSNPNGLLDIRTIGEGIPAA